MNVITKLITTDKIAPFGIWEGCSYDLYKQIRVDARHDKIQWRFIERYHPIIDNSIEGVPPRIIRPVEKSNWYY